jgi:hypothetical protein
MLRLKGRVHDFTLQAVTANTKSAMAAVEAAVRRWFQNVQSVR